MAALFGLTRQKISLFDSDDIKYIKTRIRENLNPNYITQTVKPPVNVMWLYCYFEILKNHKYQKPWVEFM